MPNSHLKAVAIVVREQEPELTAEQREVFMNKMTDSEVGRQFEIRGLGGSYLKNYTHLEVVNETRDRGFTVTDEENLLGEQLEIAECAIDLTPVLEDIHTALSINDEKKALELVRLMLFATLNKAV